ncbi:MAG: hypothetical protein JW908_09815 [Anaerolineales bacterium]|nr:hypothetical protein [Anaerolineales bacterium]
MMNQRRIAFRDKRIIRPVVLFGGVLVSIILLIISCLLVVLLRNQVTIPENPTAVIRYIPAPTATQTMLPLETSPDVLATDMPPGENLRVGVNIRVQGTGGDGLRLRSMAGLNGKVEFLVKEGAELIIDDGPKSIDGYTWWHVKSSTDTKISGWGVANYMVFIQKP